jgi:hypothetical protein
MFSGFTPSCSAPQSVMTAMNNAWKYVGRYGYPDGNIVEAIAPQLFSLLLSLTIAS